MQKFIRIFGLLIFILSLGACVKEEITTFDQKIFQNWRQQESKYLLFDEDNELDTTLFVKNWSESLDTVSLLEFEKDDSLTQFLGKAFIELQDGLMYDTIIHNRVFWEEKGDNEIVVGNNVFEIYHLEFDRLILREYVFELFMGYPYRIVETYYTPFIEEELIPMDTIDIL